MQHQFFSACVDSFMQDDEGVTALVSLAATADREAHTRTVRARYLIGCDGPRSSVRKALNIRYDGVAGEKREFMGGQMDAVYFFMRQRSTALPSVPLHGNTGLSARPSAHC
ncbi:FAD-dependent monooxygenase [Undibacterium arcticum]